MPFKKQSEKAENDLFFSRRERGFKKKLEELRQSELKQRDPKENADLREKLERGVRPTHKYRSSFY
ncbi:hypothetical protein [Ruegeria marina]|uniref:Uncharacterized protein n=1 Tax=Ruegeria marina TaxID=639004 RepID=A0A1G6LGJ1_9RHOB|nr:hypothetical protein [Ruegeria marina]SDC42552.1 hypothetical protein SAMN04488239_102241 [Ruegeria marina]